MLNVKGVNLSERNREIQVCNPHFMSDTISVLKYVY